jgi:phospholipid/cholesterol/gamma-HCH transport system substrate-binding protein
MKTKTVDSAKLGIFVLAGILFLIITLYMIGKNRNLFGSTFTLKAVVTNVNGLVAGNNVRFKGIDVGTVKSIEIANDTLIYVIMTIDEGMKPFIKQNALVSIGTDGLMGNKLMNINSQPGMSPSVEEGFLIQSRKPIETEEMLRTLNATNNNMEKITYNLHAITGKLNNSNSLWNLLADTLVTQDLKYAVQDFRQAGSNTASMTRKANNLITSLTEGQGLAKALFTDTVLSNKLYYSLDEIQRASARLSFMSKNLDSVVLKLKAGEGTAGLVLSDTAMRNKLFRSATNIEQSTIRFNENMEAMRSNFLFKGYFKDLEKKEKKKTPN